ncbi:MAG TPA: Ig-like domain-containing protein [Pyrinomonadaceae bacterium]|nr:Ig-like domain-containing protein [Pyrinomonadaceae bacterium]
MPDVILLETGTSGVLLENGAGFLLMDVAVADITVPTVTITEPAAGATISGATNPFTATATDNVAVRGIKFYLDNAPVGTEDTTSPYSVNIDATTLASGTHTLKAVAYDTAGNASAEATRSVTVAAPDPINYALASNGGVATASRSLDAAKYPPSSANNGVKAPVNNAEHWVALSVNAPFPPNVQAFMNITLSAARTVSQFGVITFATGGLSPNVPIANETLCTGTIHLTGYTVQYKNNAGAWIDTEVVITGNNLAYRLTTLAASVTATEFRLAITGGADGHGRLVEFEIWGT